MMNQKGNLRLREGQQEDVEFLYRLRNDVEVRKNSFHEEVIPFEKHIAWYKERLLDEKCKIYVLEKMGERIGQVRIDRIIEEEQGNVEVWQISYSVAAYHRGHGYAKIMLELLESNVKNVILLGEVKQANLASQKVFQQLGYLELCAEYGYTYTKKLTNNV